MLEKVRVTQIAREVYYLGLGRTDWSEVKIEYGLSQTELNYVISLIRNWNRI